MDLRSISKDNVGGNPQDDVWSAVIVNIPENKYVQFWYFLNFKLERQ